MRLASFDVGNEADTARVLIEGRVIKTLRGRNAWADIASFHHSSAPARIVIGSIRPQRCWRDWPVKGIDRAHRLFASSPAAFGRPAHPLPPRPRVGAAARRPKYVKQATFSPADFLT